MTSVILCLVATVALAADPSPGGLPSGLPLAHAAKPASSQIYFVGPDGLTVQWDVTALGRFDSEKLAAPARYNFPQGAFYRLKLANIPGRPGVELFPSLEVAPAMPRTTAYLEHNAIPVEFTDEDFDQVMTGNPVTKVIYLPDPGFQEMALAGVGTLVSTRLDPGVDPIVEADRRGAIMAIVRLSPAQAHSARTAPGRPTADFPAGTKHPVAPYPNNITSVPGTAPGSVPGTVAVPSSSPDCAPAAFTSGAAPSAAPNSPTSAAATWGYPDFGAGPAPAPGGLAANPAFGTAVKVTDVIAMTRAKVAENLIVTQIRYHGLAAPLRPADIITLSQSGVSNELISAMETVVAKGEYCDPGAAAAPKVLNSSYETPQPAQTHPMSDPNRRAQEAIYTSENLRLLQDEWQRSGLLNEPGNTSPNRSPAAAPKAPDSPRIPTTNADRVGSHAPNDKVPVLGPFQAGAPDVGLDSPSEDEVMSKLELARPLQSNLLSGRTVERKKVRIVCEPIQDSLDPPKVSPVHGSLQVHHVHFKCTVYFTEVTHTAGPNPVTHVDEDCQEVIYIDHDHLHRVGQPAARS
jgi:hypothetical protein